MPESATATLRDVTVPNPTPAAAEPAQTTETPAAPATTPVEVADKDAAELGRLLLDSGITKDQINDVLAAPQALSAIKYMVENDPQEFIRSLERTNPGAGENFLDKLSKLYVDRYERPAATAPNGTTAPEVTNELQAKLQELTEKVTGFETKEQQRANATAMAQVNARYDARVDDLFGQLPPDKVPLTPYEKILIKDALGNRLGRDANVAKRVYNGNFVDVPREFQTIVGGLLNDRKATADAEKAKRERVTSVAFPEISGGPVELPKDFYDVTNTPVEDLWSEDAFVKALTRG